MDSGLPDLRELLLFYADAGVDDALEDSPADRFAESAPLRRNTGASGGVLQADAPGQRPEQGSAPRETRTLPPPTRAEAAAVVPDEAQAARARELARSAATLDELRALLEGFDGCNLKLTAKTLVFADGNPQADVMLVGEAPGRDEDLEGLPFVGRSGRLLDQMLAAIGLDRSRVYIANVIPWRPPGNRTPTPLETEICRPFVERQVELANPKVLVTLGGPSAKVLLHASDGVLRMRGAWKSHTTAGGTIIPAMPTLHPAYLLRNPAHKRLAWRDFLEVKARLRELA
jgi:uracil-DNA glycosylase family 4